MQNESTTTWVNDPLDPDAVGIYVRKNCASTLGSPDDEEGGSIFRCPGWESDQHRAAWMSEDEAGPGELATFEFTLCTDGIAPGEYREDFGIAHGSDWIDNPFNGDPLGKLAVWVPVHVKGTMTGPTPQMCATVSVNGRVTAQGTGDGIANARVSIGGQVGQTDANGDYALSNIMPGKYAVHISADGYEPYKGEVTIQVDTSATHNATLKPMSSNGFWLPYPGGNKYRCTQGNNRDGGSTHYGRLKYAVDVSSHILQAKMSQANGMTLYRQGVVITTRWWQQHGMM